VTKNQTRLSDQVATSTEKLHIVNYAIGAVNKVKLCVFCVFCGSVVNCFLIYFGCISSNLNPVHYLSDQTWSFTDNFYLARYVYKLSGCALLEMIKI
jgi:hypothetical protein